MTPTSLGLRTDLIFHRYHGWVVDRGSYLFVETPANPDFHWGNTIYFGLPPKTGDRLPWMRLWRKEFAHNPEIRHVSFAWEGGEGDYEDFLEAGFDLQRSVVLTAEKVKPPAKRPESFSVRKLISDMDWREATQIQIESRGEEYDRESYTRFKVKHMQGYREMIAKGHGNWFGAFLGDTQVGNLGLFFDGDLGRFQTIAVAPEFRRKGVCSNLLFETAREALASKAAKTLVIVADELGIARDIYQTTGFRLAEQLCGVVWWPGYSERK